MTVSKLLVNTYLDVFIASSVFTPVSGHLQCKYLYRNSASQMFAKQSNSFLSLTKSGTPVWPLDFPINIYSAPQKKYVNLAKQDPGRARQKR